MGKLQMLNTVNIQSKILTKPNRYLKQAGFFSTRIQQ